MFFRRSPGPRWILTKTLGGRSVLVTLRLMTWTWSDSNMYRKARGSATFASTDLFKHQARPPMSHLSSHVLFFFVISCPLLSFSPRPRHVFFALYPRLRIPIFMGCFLKRRVVGCYGVPHCPKFPFSSPLSNPSGR